MSTGVVTTYLNNLIARQVEDHRLVVWYDPEQAYTTAAAALQLPHTTLACYNGSFFQLRHDIDALLNDEQPPRLLVYVSEERGNTHHALIELKAAGVVLQLFCRRGRDGLSDWLHAECITSRFEGDVTSGAGLPDISAKPSVHDVC